MTLSRQELVQWLNSLLKLNITKVEQCGTGAAFCQVYDSIFSDVPMPRVKFNENSEYAYLQNFKILQNTFTKHNIERSIPVEQLVKCRMQDNLEFLQWTHNYWKNHYPGGEYDAVGRRRGGPLPSGTGPASRAPSGAARRPGGTTPTTGPRLGVKGGAGGGGAAAAALQQENNTLKETVVGLERERDFYFSKLRDIELLIQQAVEEDPEIDKQEDGLVKQIQTILYSTEEGFEIPETEQQQLDDQETF